MAKARSIIGFMLFLWALRPSSRPRMPKLSDEERQLLERYRSLSEADRTAMYCLLNVMESASRF